MLTTARAGAFTALLVTLAVAPAAAQGTSDGIGDRWQIVSDIWNSNQSPAAA